MPGVDPSPSLHDAAEELSRYLSGEIAPMMAAWSFEALATQPPELTAGIIAQWIRSQPRQQAGDAATADLIVDAVNKLSLLFDPEFDRSTTFPRAIHEIAKLLLQFCPETQRAELRIRLRLLDASPRPATTAAKTETKPARPRLDAETMDRGERALSLLLGQLAKLRNASVPAGKQGPEAMMLAQVLTTAALQSKTNEELARHLLRVKKGGVAIQTGKVFRALGWSLPGWGTIGAGGKPIGARTGPQLKAMDRIVALVPDARDRAVRWGELVYAAIEQLNEGRLAQAVSILEVAKRLIAESRPDGDIVAQVLSQTGASIPEDILRGLADVPAKHALLRNVLEFFPSLRPDMLLAHLDGELRRERRKLILTLLECHGAGCRDAVITKLAAVVRGEFPDEDGFYRRNLAFLLRRIPRCGHERIDVETDLLAAMIGPGAAPIAVKEAVAVLGQLRHAPAELALVERLHRLETELIAEGGNPEGWKLADQLCVALARQGTVRAVRVVAAHAYNRSPALGGAFARFAHLSRLDLTIDPEQLEVLLKAIRARASMKVFGFVATGVHHELSCLMQAVAGTPTPEVRGALLAIAAKFERHALGDQARRLLATLEPHARTTTEASTGDLDLYGLPSLLQSLAGSGSSGELVLFDDRQTRRGSIAMANGRIARCEAGRLSGAEAVYLFMEKPFTGTFTFRTVSNDSRPTARELLDPLSLILEGAIRHDEYQIGRAFAPDGVRYEPAGLKAHPPEDENDGDFVSNVWDRAAAGTPANDCELEMNTDPFRVRRLYAHWVESRALRQRA